jgi:hypothetical protein
MLVAERIYVLEGRELRLIGHVGERDRRAALVLREQNSDDLRRVDLRPTQEHGAQVEATLELADLMPENGQAAWHRSVWRLRPRLLCGLARIGLSRAGSPRTGLGSGPPTAA